MILNDILNLIGLIFNVFGSMILAVSLSKYITSIHGTIAIHDMQLEAIINKKDKILKGDISDLLKRGVKNGRRRTIIGIILLTFGFLLQLMPYLILYKYYLSI